MTINKSILITGCSSGIGLFSAYFLRDKGYRVFATARKQTDIQKLKDEGFEAFRLDVTDTKSINETKNAILDINKGTLYALFNNAGFGQPGAIEDISTKALKEQFGTNVFGAHNMIRAFMPIFRAQKQGRIIQHSSILGLVSLKFRGAYNASKYALEGLSDTLRLECKNSNIKIITLNTGPIQSDFRKNANIKFQENINIQNSHFSDTYKDMLKKHDEKSKDYFTQKPHKVAQKLLYALELKNPKPRYNITFASTLLTSLKRILSTNILDKVLTTIK